MIDVLSGALDGHVPTINCFYHKVSFHAVTDVELVYFKINLEGCIDDEHQFKTAKCP